MSTARQLLVLHVRSRRRHAPRYQQLLDTLNAAAMRAFDEAGWDATLVAAAETDRLDVLQQARTADAIVLMGGEDIDPMLYGGATDYPGSGAHETQADRTMIAVVHQALRRRTPLLGICRGHQLINVALGGTLIQHLDGHRIPASEVFVSTPVVVRSGEDAVFKVGRQARCSHHQAVAELGKGLRVIARAPDSIIEAIAHESAPIVGVQWHPEHPDVASRQLPPLLEHCVALAAGTR